MKIKLPLPKISEIIVLVKHRGSITTMMDRLDTRLELLQIKLESVDDKLVVVEKLLEEVKK